MKVACGSSGIALLTP
nr:hypothetical protein [Vibrio parahaemolyticus]